MNAVRTAISVFILILIVLAVAGWMWTGSHQSPPHALASRTVLTVAAAAGAIGLVQIWRR